ncbi:hypothetical protein ACTXT7_001592 [Hymenolepis weldensis]
MTSDHKLGLLVLQKKKIEKLIHLFSPEMNPDARIHLLPPLDRGGVTAAFEKDDYDAPNVQINFAQHDLACKQRALEQLEQRCQESVAVEERRRFAELATCLSPLVTCLTLAHWALFSIFIEFCVKYGCIMKKQFGGIHRLKYLQETEFQAFLRLYEIPDFGSFLDCTRTTHACHSPAPALPSQRLCSSSLTRLNPHCDLINTFWPMALGVAAFQKKPMLAIKSRKSWVRYPSVHIRGAKWQITLMYFQANLYSTSPEYYVVLGSLKLKYSQFTNIANGISFHLPKFFYFVGYLDVIDAHLNVLADMGSLEEVLKEIQAAHSAVIVSVTDSNTTPISTDANTDGTFRLLSTPLVKSNGQITTNSSTTATNNHQNIPLDPTIATGSAALSYAVAPAPSTLSITSTSTNGGGSLLFGHADSISTLHSPDADGVSRGIHHSSIPPQPASAGLGCAGSPGLFETCGFLRTQILFLKNLVGKTICGTIISIRRSSKLVADRKTEVFKKNRSDSGCMVRQFVYLLDGSGKTGFEYLIMDGCSTFRRRKTGADSLMNGGGSVLGGGGGDALSLFDHNQSISGAPTVRSASSSSSLGLLPINCDANSVISQASIISKSQNALENSNEYAYNEDVEHLYYDESILNEAFMTPCSAENLFWALESMQMPIVETLQAIVESYIDSVVNGRPLVFQRDSVPSHKVLNTPDWIDSRGPNLWPSPNYSSDPNPLHHYVWGGAGRGRKGSVGSLGDSGSSNGVGDGNGVDANGDHHAATNDSDDGSDEDGGTTEGCLTEDDDNDETLEQSNHTNGISTINTAPSTTMVSSIISGAIIAGDLVTVFKLIMLVGVDGPKKTMSGLD